MALLAFDNFARPDANPIGAPYAGNGVDAQIQLVSNAGAPSAVGTRCLSIYDSVAWPADQWGQVTVTKLSNGLVGFNYVGFGLRASKTQSTYYSILFGVQGDAQVYIQKVINGAAAVNIIPATPYTPALNDNYFVKMVGTTISVYQNGNLIATADDSSIASGQFALLMYDSDVDFSNLQIGRFFAGDYSIDVAGLDTNAWEFPGNAYTATEGIWMDASNMSISANMLNMRVFYGPLSSPGTRYHPTEETPTVGGTILWKKQQLLYGTVEFRAKYTGLNIHMTAWLFGVPSQNTAYQYSTFAPRNPVREFDIAEALPAVYGNTTSMRNTFFNDAGDSTLTQTTITDYSQNFHTYKIVWTPTSVTWFIDGVQTFQVTDSDFAIPNYPMYFLWDMEVDGGGGTPDAGNFPQTAQMDYIRAWDKDGVLIFSDDFDGSAAFQKLDRANLFVQQNITNFANGTSYDCTYLAPNHVGDLLIAISYNNGGSATPTITDTLGNVWELLDIEPNFDAVTGTFAVFVCRNCKAGTPTVTYHTNAAIGTGDLILFEYRPCTIDVHGIATGTDTAPTSPTVITTAADELIFGYTANGAGSVLPALPDVQRASDGAFTLAQDVISGVAGSYSSVFASASGAWAAGIIALAPRGSGGGGGVRTASLIGTNLGTRVL